MAKQPAITIPEGCTKVLLHACCAPCSSAIVEWLLAHQITPIIFYFNPNIYPLKEYEIRKNESKRHAESLGITWIDADRVAPGGGNGHEAWLQAVRGLEHEPERGRRCEACFYYRLLATARKAKELNIPFFATTLASSRWKNLDQINAAGLKAEEKMNQTRPDANTPHGLLRPDAIRFWAQNWRKDGLQERRNQLLQQYAFYNQTYCGCEFSMPAAQRENVCPAAL